MTDIIFFIIFLILEVKHSGRLVSKTVFFFRGKKKEFKPKDKKCIFAADKLFTNN